MATLSTLYLEISSGSGGQESQDWVTMLLNMYLKFCTKLSLEVELLYTNKGTGGIRSTALLVRGAKAFMLQHESGVHRLIRISPFDSSKRRHTSFAYVYVYEPIAQRNSVHILPKELKIDTYRSSGPGGQHVNKTDSAVRITHLPTGLKAECQNGRSQQRNKEQALEQLQAKLLAYQRQQRQQQVSELRNTVDARGCWSNYIRSYILDRNQVKDHRSNFSSSKVKNILQGDLLPLIESLTCT